MSAELGLDHSGSAVVSLPGREGVDHAGHAGLGQDEYVDLRGQVAGLVGDDRVMSFRVARLQRLERPTPGSRHVVLLADSGKLRQTAPVPICDRSEIDAFVTDAAITEAQRASLPPGTRLLVAQV